MFYTWRRLLLSKFRLTYKHVLLIRDQKDRALSMRTCNASDRILPTIYRSGNAKIHYFLYE